MIAIGTSPPPRWTRARITAFASEVFIGVGALVGGYELLTDAEGFGLPEAWLHGSPFADYLIPGLFLFSVLGVGMLVAAAITLVRGRWWAPVALAMGVILTAWLLIETAIVGYRGWQQALLLVVCGVPAAMLVVGGWKASDFGALVRARP